MFGYKCAPVILPSKNNTVDFPPYRRSSSFSSLIPCLSETWGDLPLKVDDSEDMVIYGLLHDAVSAGWTPFNISATNVTVDFPPYRRSSSFSSLIPCLSETWGDFTDLPLKVDDSEDMVIYGFLHDAVSAGWTPFNISATNVKIEPRYETEPATTASMPQLAAPRVNVFSPQFREYMERELYDSSRVEIGTPIWKETIWVFWDRLDGYPDLTLPNGHSVDFNPNLCPSSRVRLKIRGALRKMILDARLRSSLLQFWAPKKTLEGRTYLTVQNQPFAFGLHDYSPSGSGDLFCQYRTGICNFFFDANTECAEEQLGLPARVFLHKLPVAAPYLNYNTLDLASSCQIKASLVVPVFENGSSTCVGVLEISSYFPWYLSGYHGKFLDRIGEIFQEFGLSATECVSSLEHFNDERAMLQLGYKPSIDSITNGSEAQNSNSPNLGHLKDEPATLQPGYQPSVDSNSPILVSFANGIEVTRVDSFYQKSHSVETISATGCIPRQWRQPSVDSVNNGMYAYTEAQNSYTLSDSSHDSLKNGIEMMQVDSSDQASSDQASVYSSKSFEDQEQSMELNSDDRASAVSAFRNPGIQDANTVTVKARVENYYTIKFSLSLTPRLVELQEEVTKRKIDPGAYDIICTDEGEKPIGCDYDLQQWIEKSILLGNTPITVTLRLRPKQPTPT